MKIITDDNEYSRAMKNVYLYLSIMCCAYAAQIKYIHPGLAQKWITKLILVYQFNEWQIKIKVNTIAKQRNLYEQVHAVNWITNDKK